MKAIQVVAPGRLELMELPSRLLKAWEVRIVVASTCVCGSDLKNIRAPVQVPQVLGHEFSGVVVEASPEAKEKLSFGSRVTAFPMIACLECSDCRCGRFRDCARKLSLGFQLPGSFAEEVIVDSRLVVPLADGLTYEQGALVEHLCCGYRVAKEIVSHQVPGDAHIVLIGDGPIALADLQALSLFGYRNITLIGKHSLRMAVAKKLGANRVLALSEVGAAVENRSLAAVDVCVMSASAEQTLQHLLLLLMPRALVFPQTRIRNATLLRYLEDHGVVFGRAFAYEVGDFYEVIGLIKNGKLLTSFLLTNRVDLLQFVEMFPTILKKHEHLKTVIVNRRLNEIVENYRGASHE